MKRIAVSILVVLVAGFSIIGCSAPAPPPQQPVSQPDTLSLVIDLLGKKSLFALDSQGRLNSRAQSEAPDGRISLSADKGTRLLSEDKTPLSLIQVAVDSPPPPAPDGANIIGTVYELTPRGAMFDPFLALAVGYGAEKLPPGASPDNLYVAFFDGNGWQRMRYKYTDTTASRVTTQIQQSVRFALLAEKTTASAPTTLTGTQVGNLAPDFSFVLDSQLNSLSGLREKPVMLNFWATWCNPCRIEMPFLQEVYREGSGKGLQMLAINVGENKATVQAFMQSSKLSLPVVLDSTGETARKYRIKPIPVTYFIDKSGIIRAVKIGAFSSKAEIEKSLKLILP